MKKSTGSCYMLALAFVSFTACQQLRTLPGGELSAYPPGQVRTPNPADVSVPEGYQIEVVARHLSFPTAIALDEQGRLFVLEAGYAHGDMLLQPKLLYVADNGSTTLLAEGEKGVQWTGMSWHQGNFYVAQEQKSKGSKLLRISPSGEIHTLMQYQSDKGDHHIKGPVVKGGFLYFGHTTTTGASEPAAAYAGFEWLYRYPDLHDTSHYAYSLPETSYVAANQRTYRPAVSYATITTQQSKAAPGAVSNTVPCKGAIMRLPLGGGRAEVVAWGLRNPFGLALSLQGELYVTENSYELRGNRPLWGTGDVLWQIREGAWYGWPDFGGALPLQQHELPQSEGPLPAPARHPNKPPRPAASLGTHTYSNGIAFSHGSQFGFAGDAFIAQFGHEAGATGKKGGSAGYKIMRVNLETGHTSDFAVNKGNFNGPASLLKQGGMEHPIALSFSPAGDALYVVDFGLLHLKEARNMPGMHTGMIWKISKKAAMP